jgi:GST-like protein
MLDAHELHAFDTPNGRKISVALEEMALPYIVTIVDIRKGHQFDPNS